MHTCTCSHAWYMQTQYLYSQMTMQSFTSLYHLEILQRARIAKLRTGECFNTEQEDGVFQQPLWRSNTWKVSDNDVRKTKVCHQLIRNFPVQELGWFDSGPEVHLTLIKYSNLKHLATYTLHFIHIRWKVHLFIVYNMKCRISFVV